MMTIPADVIRKFKSWNEDTNFQTTEYDQRFVTALLLILVKESVLATSAIDEEVLEFVSGEIHIFII